MKTWDEFIARQVQAVLMEEFVLASGWADLHVLMAANRGTRGPKGGMVWLYGFGRLPVGYESFYGHWNYVTERWYVNITQKKVLLTT